MTMSATKFLVLLALSFFISTTCGDGEVPAQDNRSDGSSPPAGCGNCTICPYTCNTPPPPPASGYPSYGAPPPPPAQAYCPPAPVQCCQTSPPIPYYSPPTPYYYPYSNYSASEKLQPTIRPFTSTESLATFLVSIIFFGLHF